MSHSGDSLPVMASDNGMQNLSPGAHLHSNKPPTSCSPFCSFSIFFFKLFQTENKLHFSRDRGVIIWAFRTSHSLRVSDVLFHTSLVAYSCIETSVLRMAWHTLYSTRAVMECLVMLNGNLRETCQEKEKRKEKSLLCMVKSLHDLAYWGRQAHCAQ